jgi:hypothetical protein
VNHEQQRDPIDCDISHGCWILRGTSSNRSSIGELVDTSQPAKAIKAEALQLVDGHGEIHASLNITKEGSPGLIFFDETHNPRVILDMTGNGDPRLFLFDREGRIRTIFGLGLEEDGSPFMALKKNENREVIWSAP